jgi:hypothetical protein
MGSQAYVGWVEHSLAILRAALSGHYVGDEALRGSAIAACHWMLGQLEQLSGVDVVTTPAAPTLPRTSVAEMLAGCVAKLLPHLRPDVREQLAPLAQPPVAEQWIRHVVAHWAKRVVEGAVE